MSKGAKRNGLVVVLSAAAAAIVVVLTLTIQRAVAANPDLQGFTFEQARFDESMGDKLPTPQIPKTWKLISVSNGEKANGNNLWFQDTDGTLYIVSGFMSGRKFVVQPRIQKLETKN